MGQTQIKGDLATSQAIASFTRAGFNVSVPITESASYDLVIEYKKFLWTVQVKYCGSQDNMLGLRRIHSNSKGYVVKHYVTKDFDLLYVLRSDDQEYLYQNEWEGKTAMAITNPLAHFDKVIETIREGTAKWLATRFEPVGGGSRGFDSSTLCQEQEET